MLFRSFQKTTGAYGGDTHNWFAFGDCSYGNGGGAGRGVGSLNGFLANNTGRPVVGLWSDGTANTYNQGPWDSGLGPRTIFGNKEYVENVGLDSISGVYDGFPLGVATFPRNGNAPFGYRGRLPDLYCIGTAPVGASIPGGGPLTERVVVGNLAMPFTGGSPNL